MKHLLPLLALASAATLTANVHAGSGSGTVRIEHVGDWNNKDLLFFYTSNKSNQPSCNTYRQRWVLDLGTELGQRQYSMLLTAQTTNSNVAIGGRNTCNLYGGSEDVHWIGYR